MGFWKNTETLFEHALQVTGANETMEYGLGVVMHKKGKLDEAEKRYRNAIKINPQAAESYSNLGAILMVQGKFNEAAEILKRLLL